MRERLWGLAAQYGKTTTVLFGAQRGARRVEITIELIKRI